MKHNRKKVTILKKTFEEKFAELFPNIIIEEDDEDGIIKNTNISTSEIYEKYISLLGNLTFFDIEKIKNINDKNKLIKEVKDNLKKSIISFIREENNWKGQRHIQEAIVFEDFLRNQEYYGIKI